MSGRRAITAIILCFAVAACNNNSPDKNEEPLARVYDKYLYVSDIEGLLHDDISPEDSTRIVDEFIDNWIRRQLILKVAEDNVQPYIDEINRQAEDSRQSLIISAYERQWLRQNLDTVVAFDTIQAYYENHHDELVLKSDIYRLSYAVVPKEVKSADSIAFWFTKGIEKYQYALERYCAGNCREFSINSGIWFSEDNLFNLLPYDMYANGKFRTKGLVKWTDEANHYFVMVSDFYKSGEVGPFEFYIESIKDIIVHQRKNEMVKLIYREIYSEGFKRDNAEIYKSTK